MKIILSALLALFASVSFAQTIHGPPYIDYSTTPVPGHCWTVGTAGGGQMVDAACSGGSGTVTTTGSPVNGNMTKFSGATSITNAVPGSDYVAPPLLDPGTPGDADYAIPAGYLQTNTNVTLTAPRTWTLPPISGFSTLQYYCAFDVFGGVTSTNTITLAAHAGDTLTGTAVIDTANGIVCPQKINSTTWQVSQISRVNGLHVTPSTGTLTVANGKTATFNNSIALSGTDGSTFNVGSGGTYNLLGQWSIPIILVSSGTMGNNGALSAITALPETFANAFVCLPAGAIATGVPASETCYYTQMSSTTAGTVCNNTLSSGVPTIPGSCTAFSTTGPGAFTQSTAEQTLLTFPIAGHVIGTNGLLKYSPFYEWTSSGNNKTFRAKYASTIFWATQVTTSIALRSIIDILNTGSESAQLSVSNTTGNGALGGAVVPGSVNTGSSFNFVVTGQLANAADNMILRAVSLLVTSP